MPYTRTRKEGSPLKQALYQTGRFARRAGVTLRTLRFYDRVGLLSPSARTESGYRLYRDEDLVTLQRILALKYLGLSLDEIRVCLDRGPRGLPEVLAQQRTMLEERRCRLDGVIEAIDSARAAMAAGDLRDWDAVARVIQVMQMEQNTDWVKKYFPEDKLRQMQELTDQSYSAEARNQLAQRGPWTEEDQKRASEQWAYVASEAERLAAAGADPAGAEAQALAEFKSNLLRQFTQGDPEIEAGLRRFWESHNALPAERQPLPAPVGSAGAELLERAMAHYHAQTR